MGFRVGMGVGLSVVARAVSCVDSRGVSNVVSSVDSRDVSSAGGIAVEGDVADSMVPAAVAAASVVAVGEHPGINNRSTRSTSMDLNLCMNFKIITLQVDNKAKHFLSETSWFSEASDLQHHIIQR